ncbi:TetR/AcrR family transcriptional regulator [Pelovirga terrestris]|uniref:TetR/AcrR family transcriptional regulator n=1 Tax=Pelovirga terrestris TaxID=2771352 RepID=A0A8J6QZU6_9BACT|nr:TetR/AcrR family transcriptional regulator [Pelovirga terrestris]MBD1401607.1 TetR/AcrR family transcriptional regulator [Pelovirga terrestris]
MAKAQFDRNQVVDRSIKLFWQNGFSASSMQQVVKNTGLQPGSIYLAFGSKEGLFREALEEYARKSKEYIRKRLDSAPSIGEGICAILDEMVEDSLRRNYCSCFLIKTQLELAAQRNEFYDFAAAQLAGIEELYRSYLAREFDADLSRKRASSLMLHIFGVKVYSYQRDSTARMREGLREGLPWLPWPQQQPGSA